jgi:hypothetical protein
MSSSSASISSVSGIMIALSEPVNVSSSYSSSSSQNEFISTHLFKSINGFSSNISGTTSIQLELSD